MPLLLLLPSEAPLFFLPWPSGPPDCTGVRDSSSPCTWGLRHGWPGCTATVAACWVTVSQRPLPGHQRKAVAQVYDHPTEV